MSDEARRREAAQKQLDDLKRQYAETEREIVDHTAKEAQMALGAFTGDKSARSALGEWEKKQADLQNRRRQISLAVPIAAANVSQAEARIAARADIAKAEAQMELAHAISANATKLDRLLDEFCAEFLELRKNTIAAGIYNIGAIEAQRRAIQTALLKVGLHSQPMPHNFRITFGDLAKNWRARARGEANKTINEARTVLGEAREAEKEAAA